MRRIATDQRALTQLLVQIVAALLILAPTVYGIRTWLDPREAWIHPELFGTSQYVWMNGDESVWMRLRKAADWKAFDPNVNRVRPVSDLVDTVDTVIRPYQTRILGPHPSITPSAVLTAVIAPLVMFFYLRRLGLGLVPASALTGLFISSIGLLSVLVVYVRPAKKVTVVTFAVSLFLAERHRRTGDRGSFWALVGVMFASLFADELDLAKYPIIGLMYGRSLVWNAPRWKALTFLAIPLAYLAAVAWALPAFYLAFSVHGQWDALSDGQKLAVFRFLVTPYYWVVGITQFARALLTTAGVGVHTPLHEGIALAAFSAATALPLLRRMGTGQQRYGLFASAASLVAMVYYATLLDFYPDVAQLTDRAYLSSFTFYYHSAVPIMVIVWAAHVWLTVSDGLTVQVERRRVAETLAVAGCVLAMIGSFATWHQVNLLAQTIHLYPYTSESLFAVLREHQRELRVSRPERPVALTFIKEREVLDAEYDATLRQLYGDRWQDTVWYRQLETFKKTPIMLDQNVEHLVHAYFPRDSYIVQIHGSPVLGEDPEGGPAAP
ncbi:MAG: hypothetical protein AB7K36_02630 [Chloroflexota bacterium]